MLYESLSGLLGQHTDRRRAVVERARNALLERGRREEMKLPSVRLEESHRQSAAIRVANGTPRQSFNVEGNTAPHKFWG